MPRARGRTARRDARRRRTRHRMTARWHVCRPARRTPPDPHLPAAAATPIIAPQPQRAGGAPPPPPSRDPLAYTRLHSSAARSFASTAQPPPPPLREQLRRAVLRDTCAKDWLLLRIGCVLPVVGRAPPKPLASRRRNRAWTSRRQPGWSPTGWARLGRRVDAPVLGVVFNRSANSSPTVRFLLGAICVRSGTTV